MSPVNFLHNQPSQTKLPLHARATASTAIKNNLANTELETGPDTQHLTNKTHRILSLHLEHRANQRMQVQRGGGCVKRVGVC